MTVNLNLPMSQIQIHSNSTEDENIHTFSELNSDTAASNEEIPCGESLSINDEEANFPSASVIDDASQ